MKVIIFAGGMGTRLWPLSRRSSPKQFEKVLGDKSTLQLAVERLVPDFAWKDIYIATNQQYKKIVLEQLPNLPLNNVICESESRDVGPAVALVTAILYKKYPNEPIVILWSDHSIKKVDLFKHLLSTAEKVIKDSKTKMVCIAQKSRFASQNLGWILLGKSVFKKDSINFLKFEDFFYRPSLDEAKKYFKSGKYAWNLGYFVTTPAFLWKLYQKYQPEIFEKMKIIYNSQGSSNFSSIVNETYRLFPKISFDNAILEKLSSENILAVSEDLGWSDVGTWEALKEALQSSPDQNVTQGKVLLTDCQDSLVYNYTDQLVVTIDAEGLMVVNTHDVLLVCHKRSVPKIKKLVERLAETENDHLV